MLQIPLNQLKHAKDNVRKVKSSSQSLNSLAASIESQGLLHNLVIRKNGKGYEVIDGNRRLEALKKIYGKEAANEINCIEITESDNEVGLHANMMREDMHPLDECDVIHALCADGEEDFDSVGKRFSQTNQWVKQRVALSELSDKAKEMFRNYDFGIGVASVGFLRRFVTRSALARRLARRLARLARLACLWRFNRLGLRLGTTLGWLARIVAWLAGRCHALRVFGAR